VSNPAAQIIPPEESQPPGSSDPALTPSTSRVSSPAPLRQSQAPNSLLQDALRRLKRDKLAIAGLVIIVLFVIAAVFAPLLAPYDPTAQKILLRRQPPSRLHWMGLDEVGRDIFSRLIYGARISLQIGLLSVTLAIVIGSMLGAIAGFVGGWLDDLIMRLMDILLAFPGLLLAIAVVSILGPGLMNMMYAIAFVSIPAYARIMRASVLSVKEQEFVVAARAVGVPTMRILWREILPNSFTPVLVAGTLGIATAILDAAGLSFLGLGARPPTPEWGSMLGEGRGSVFTAPHIVIFPGLAIMLNVLGFNLLGDGLRDALDPRLRM
jgi:peptide/nickel transport system permease protein